jgi:hypothetical protein
MWRLTLLAMVGLGLMACQTDLREQAGGSAAPDGPVTAPAGVSTEPVRGPDQAGAESDDSTTDDQGGPLSDAGDDNDPVDTNPGASDPGASDPGESGPDDDLLPPAQTEQTCSVWEDCGPHFGDRNSGFDCQGGQCACNVAGDYDEACAAIGGLWSDEQCFCFVTTSRPPAQADPDESDHVTCWWDYYKDCEADEWVDTSYYRDECNADGCRRVYVRRGYWRKGHCDDVWVRECSDGTHQEFR